MTWDICQDDGKDMKGRNLLYNRMKWEDDMGDMGVLYQSYGKIKQNIWEDHIGDMGR